MRANRKWLALAVDILSYETEHWNDGDLLSQACDSWIEKYPILARTVIVSVGALLIAHLANLLRDEFDVLSVLFWKQKRELLPNVGWKVQKTPHNEIIS